MIARYPVQTNDLYFVKHWNDDQKMHAVKLLNRNLKKFIRTRFLQDVFADLNLWMIENKTRKNTGRHKVERPLEDYRNILPGDLPNLINKFLVPKYFSDNQSTQLIGLRHFNPDFSEQVLLQASISKALSSLDHEAQLILRWFYIDEQPVGFVSSKLKITPRQVWHRKQTALNQLRKALS